MEHRKATVSVRLYVRRDLIERLVKVASDPRCSLSTLTNAAIEVALTNPSDIANNVKDVSDKWQATRT